MPTARQIEEVAVSNMFLSVTTTAATTLTQAEYIDLKTATCRACMLGRHLTDEFVEVKNEQLPLASYLDVAILGCRTSSGASDVREVTKVPTTYLGTKEPTRLWEGKQVLFSRMTWSSSIPMSNVPTWV